MHVIQPSSQDSLSSRVPAPASTLRLSQGARPAGLPPYCAVQIRRQRRVNWVGPAAAAHEAVRPNRGTNAHNHRADRGTTLATS